MVPLAATKQLIFLELHEPERFTSVLLGTNPNSASGLLSLPLTMTELRLGPIPHPSRSEEEGVAVSRALFFQMRKLEPRKEEVTCPRKFRESRE